MKGRVWVSDVTKTRDRKGNMKKGANLFLNPSTFNNLISILFFVSIFHFPVPRLKKVQQRIVQNRGD